MVTSDAGPSNPRLADWQHIIIELRHFEGMAVENFILEKNNRVRIADRRLEQAFRVGRRIRHHDLQSGNIGVPAGIILAVLRRHARRRTVRTAEDDRAAHLPAGHVERLGRRIDQLIGRLHGEVERHEFDDRLETRRAPRRYRDRQNRVR